MTMISGIRRPLIGLAAALASTALATGGMQVLPAHASSTTTQQAQPPGNTDEVATWGASADQTGGHLNDQTVRDIVHTSVGGTDMRVSLSNVFGSQPLTLDSVYVGQQSTGAAVVAGTNRPVTFDGQPSVTIPPGAEVLSDPLAGPVAPRQNLAVSVHAVGTVGDVTGHNLAQQTSYVSDAGNHAADESGAAYPTTISNWYFLDALAVTVPKQVDTVATLGDSITDGYASTVNANHRWPDYLAQRLADRPAARQYGVMNEGISGNKVLSDGAGVSAEARLDRDVLSQPDVHTVILLEAINDIGGGLTDPEPMIKAYKSMIARAHSNDVCIIGGTLTPYQGAGYYTPAGEQVREAVNHFIRTSGEFDGVVDFDKATRDPNNAKQFLPAYDSGDHLHPNDAGYKAMAAAIDLGQLECNR